MQENGIRSQVRHPILTVLRDQIGEGKHQDPGRPGMSYWKIFVLLLFNQARSTDFDRIGESALELAADTATGNARRESGSFCTADDHHQCVTGECRELATHPCDPSCNRVRIDGALAAGPEQISCDSCVVETEVLFSTDVRLLYDATRTFMKISSKAWTALLLPMMCTLTGWHQ